MKLCSEDGVEKPSLEHQCHLYSCVSVAGIVVHKRPATIMRVSYTPVVGSLKGTYICYSTLDEERLTYQLVMR